MQTVAIVGVGLIGGSFALALRGAGFTGEIVGVSSPAAIKAASERGAIDSDASLEDAARHADLIYLAQPVDGILQTLEILGPIARRGCLITDAGSTKVAIVEKASQHVQTAMFLGGHPLAGKEQRGVEAADAALFNHRPYVLTPTGDETPASQDFRSWLYRIGANVTVLSPTEHDRVVAFTSHLPQLLSTALAQTLSGQQNRYLSEIFGPGLLDMTRLALSSPDLWISILETNQAKVLEALDLFAINLSAARTAVVEHEIPQMFEAGHAFAAKLRASVIKR